MNRLLTPVIGVAIILGAAACSSDSPATTTAASSTEDPHEKISTDAEVTAGLNKMLEEAANVPTASDSSAADHAFEETHEIWESIEGTVKQKEPEVYTSIEEDLAALKTAGGDATKASNAVASLTTNVNAYLAKHPG